MWFGAQSPLASTVGNLMLNRSIVHLLFATHLEAFLCCHGGTTANYILELPSFVN